MVKTGKKSKVGDLSRGLQKTPFSIATTLRYREGATPLPGLLHFILDTYHSAEC